MAFYVYILASRRNGTLYIGMTDNLLQLFGCIKMRCFQVSRNAMALRLWSGMSNMKHGKRH